MAGRKPSAIPSSFADLHLERHRNPCGTLRLYTEGSFSEGSPFDRSMTVEFAENTAILHGAYLEDFTKAAYRQIGRTLKNEGYSRVVYRRITNGVSRWISITLDQRFD